MMPIDKQVGNENLIKKISNFVDQLRIEHEHESPRNEGFSPPPVVRSTVTAPGYEDAQKRAERAVIKAEKFRAAIETKPAGSNLPNMSFHNEL